MMAAEFITELQKLIDKNGDAEIHIYKSFEKETIPINEVYYDDEIKDIYIAIY